MTDTVKITIDDIEYDVPAGMNLVDACKMVGVDIPTFCYHPKLGHDGNCRMCLVDLATPRPNRETGEMELAWFPTLQTACTQRTSEGMAIRTVSDKVVDGRREILEFLLSSHPLDCPVCDKGGECPLQNLTMRHGPGTSRMYWDDRMRLGKHVPLGDLIYLDQERCIHCARCIRFQADIADDPVLAFDLRGRKQQIVTFSDPGFDSIWSGNTTDICPVGALTTADFRFNARPWEMVQVGTICSHCPVGCNMNFDTRTDRMAGGRTTIRRVMPRQHEQVNEIWICDKGRFAHHYMEAEDRLTMPMVRKGGKLVEATWEEAIAEIAMQLKSAGPAVGAVAGGQLSNEDLFALQKLVRMRGSNNLDVFPNNLSGGEYTVRYGIGEGSNLLDMGAGDVIIVVATDLHHEAPVWWLRLIAAAKRGATVITVNGRGTRLDDFATHSIRYTYGEEVNAINNLAGGKSDAAKAVAAAGNAVVFVGAEGLTNTSSHALTGAAASLLEKTGHFGRANNGLILVWPSANGQGASDMGFNPAFLPGYQPVEFKGKTYGEMLSALRKNDLKLLFIAGADPVFEDPEVEETIRETKGFIVVQDMFLTDTAKLADIVLPAQSIGERDGTYTSGERRLQRFYPAVEPVGESKPCWLIAELLGEALGVGEKAAATTLVFKQLCEAVAPYAGITYQQLAKVEKQFPDVGGEDLYFGGTAFTNASGLGVQLATSAEGAAAPAAASGKPLSAGNGETVIVPVNVIYDSQQSLARSEILKSRTPAPYACINPVDAARLGVTDNDMVSITLNGQKVSTAVVLDDTAPQGAIILPRRLQAQGAPLAATAAPVAKLEKVEA